MDRFVGGCVGWIAARDPRARFVGGQVGYAERCTPSSLAARWLLRTTATPASRHVGGMAGYVN